MMKKLLFLSIFVCLFSYISNSQCASIATNACNAVAPTVIGNNISCTPPIQDGGRQNFLVTNMIAGSTYQVSNCGSGLDTQTISVSSRVIDTR